MKTLMILSVILACGQAQFTGGYGAPEPLGNQYGAPAAPLGNQYGAPQFGAAPLGYPGSVSNPQPVEEEDTRPLKIVKHVFVHVAPDDQNSGVAKVIKAPIPRERQVNILFVKAPAPAAPDQQIVEIPNDGGKKTLVYVLLKKNDATPDPDFKLPGPTAPSKPEIYFIRYKDQKKPEESAAYGAPGGAESPAYGPPAPAPVAKSAHSQGGYSAPPPATGGYQKK